MVGQVKVVAILMIVQGSLALTMGLVYGGVGVMFLVMFQTSENAPQTHEETIIAMAGMAYYFAIGLLSPIAGALNIFSGIRCLKFRGRRMVLIALWSNVLPLFSCYCLPTAVATMIYGLIVMFNRDVAQAFQLGAMGRTPAEIREAFAH